MKYEEALREWGARKIEESVGRTYTFGPPARQITIDRDTVKVEMDFDEGYACCGGRDPDCYCSFAESPSAKVLITGQELKGFASGKRRETYSYSIDHDSFDFATVLREIVEASGGAVTQ